eukprot:SAG11_NODE_735_length_7452_cov_26.426629_12_plen_40_part_00
MSRTELKLLLKPYPGIGIRSLSTVYLTLSAVVHMLRPWR